MAARKSRTARRAAPTAARRKTSRRASAGRTSAPRRHLPETLRLRSLQPTLTVDDLERSLRFYTDVLGFTAGERWTDDRGTLRGAVMKAGTCRLGLAQDDWAKGRDRRKGEGVRLWCETAQDVDALAGRIVAAGGQLAQEPMDLPWGGRSLGIDDPDGYHLTIFRNRS